ncbi:MAG: TIGR02450 family Trp-rich protein, partial [Cyanobacteria bacterium J06648_11]
KWTAMQEVMGWRHFQVRDRRDRQGVTFAELASTCQPDVKVWVNAKTLRNRRLWRAGWLSLDEQRELNELETIASEMAASSEVATSTATPPSA